MFFVSFSLCGYAFIKNVQKYKNYLFKELTIDAVYYRKMDTHVPIRTSLLITEKLKN